MQHPIKKHVFWEEYAPKHLIFLRLKGDLFRKKVAKYVEKNMKKHVFHPGINSPPEFPGVPRNYPE
jgi:hypothetical protein